MYENNIEVLEKQFDEFLDLHLERSHLKDLLEFKQKYHAKEYEFFQQDGWDWDYNEYAKKYPELSKEVIDERYALRRYNKLFSWQEKIFSKTLESLFQYPSEQKAELEEAFARRDFETVYLLLPKYTKALFDKASLREKYAFFKQERTFIPLYETATEKLLSPRNIPHLFEKLEETYPNRFPFYIANYFKRCDNITEHYYHDIFREKCKDYIPNTLLLTDTHVTETYEISLQNKQDLSVKVFPLQEVELFDYGREYFQRKLMFMDPISDVYNVQITIHPKFSVEQYHTHTFPPEWQDPEGPWLREFIPEVEKKHQLTEYSIPIKEYWENGEARMDFWPYNELEVQDMYMPCEAIIQKNTCFTYSILPYYEGKILLPTKGDYIVTVEYDIAHPKRHDMYETREIQNARTIYFQNPTIPKAIKKKKMDFPLSK